MTPSGFSHFAPCGPTLHQRDSRGVNVRLSTPAASASDHQARDSLDQQARVRVAAGR